MIVPTLMLSAQLPVATAVVLATIVACLAIALVIANRKNDAEIEAGGLPLPPTPFKLPLVGHLHLLGGYKVPYQAFTDLGKKYGNVVRLQLGSVKCVVVNDQKNIKEALVTKGHHFDARPRFERYERLFSGNKENSLAFCDWSDVQKTRRDMLKMHTFPRACSTNYKKLDAIIRDGVDDVIRSIESNNAAHDPKSTILRGCANVFLKHFCSRHFDDSNANFNQVIDDFDAIFWEVNQGYAADFLPFLMPFHKRNLAKIADATHRIRNFVVDEIIADRYEQFDNFSEEDYVDSLIKHVKIDGEFDWETALFALEDIVGGHAAVGNFLLKLLAFLVANPDVQRKIQAEIDAVFNGGRVSIGQRNKMPYTEAAILEAVRLIASPIVPRVASRSSAIGGFHIEKGTVLFLNNYDLSVSEELWHEPSKFAPERFLRGDRVVKPDHFLPFGGGRRSCMGYKMVQLVGFGFLSGILQRFDLKAVAGQNYEVKVGSLALPKDAYRFEFVHRV